MHVKADAVDCPHDALFGCKLDPKVTNAQQYFAAIRHPVSMYRQ
jgi:hypothetical protein